MGKVFDKMRELMGDEALGGKTSYLGKVMRQEGVRHTAEFDRIKALPSRDWKDTAAKYKDQLNSFLRLPGGTMTLLDWQVAALAEAYENDGLLVSAGVGAGKTLVSLLLPVLVAAERPLLLVPASLRDKTLEEAIPEYRKHWILHPRLHILSYDALSRISGQDLLAQLKPDWVICDEVHKVAADDSARGRRFMRYFEEHPNTKVAAMTGTLGNNGPRNYHHILELVLRDEKFPLPRPYKEREEWLDALAIKPRQPIGAGALTDFCEPEDDGDHIKGYARRLGSVPAVIFTEASSCAVPLHIATRRVPVPNPIKDAMVILAETWCTQGGEECTTGMEVWRHMRELSCGFYYKWVWPLGQDGKPKPDQEWLSARAQWHAFVRETIKESNVYDSKLAVENAVKDGDVQAYFYNRWVAIRDRCNPPTTAVWLDDFLINDVSALVKERKAIVWVEQTAFGERLAKVSGLPFFGAGVSQADILKAKGRSVILSIKAHSEGKNFQAAWHDNIVVSSPTSGKDWEQMIGRTHRQGQLAKTVDVTVYQHTDAMQKAFGDARASAVYLESSTHQRQKLNLAVITE